MAKRPRLSTAETRIARVVWELGTASTREVIAALPEEERRDFSTIQTYLGRLEAKGYVESELNGRTKHYKAKVKPTQVIREMVDDLVDRLFAGKSLSLVRHLIDDGSVTAEELRELRELIEQVEAESDLSDS